MNLNKNNFDAMDLKPISRFRSDNSATAVKTPIGSPFKGDSSIQLSITRTTNTASPSGNFPIPLGAAAHENSDYVELLDNIPADYDLTVTDSAGNKTFSYSDGTNVIAYTVSSSTTAYRSMLQRLLSAKIKVGVTRLAVTPTTNAAVQFSANGQVVSENIFGKSDSNPLDFDLAQRPNNFQNAIIEVSQTYELSADAGILLFLNQDTTTLNVTFASSNYVLP